MSRMISTDDIAGGKVQQAFRCGDRYLMRGTVLSREEICRIPTQNRNALVDKGYIHLQLRGLDTEVKGERFVVSLGFGRFDVVEGTKLNDAHLSREAAYALAKIPLPEKKMA